MSCNLDTRARVYAGLLVILALFCAGPAAPAQDYVGSQACVDCHEQQADAWRGSHHALAWTPARRTISAPISMGLRFLMTGWMSRLT